MNVIVKALCYVIIIIVTYLLKKKKIVPLDSSRVFSSIMLTLTLPCAIVVNLNAQIIPIHMLFVIGLGIVYNVISLLIGYFVGERKKNGIMTMINVSGYNIGCFAMPFVSGVFTAQGILITSLFDIGNSLMCLGFNFGIASAIQAKRSRAHIKNVLLKVMQSVPIWTYIIMLLLCLFALQLPACFLPFFEVVGQSNAFIAMAVIGLSINIVYKKEYLLHIISVIVLRIIISILLTIISFCLPIPAVIRNVIIILCFSPIGAASIIFTRQLGLDSEEAASINSLYIIISIVIMSILIMVI
ncbi:MAG: hypothetical protein RR585_14510 [Coprobacillus sp.]